MKKILITISTTGFILFFILLYIVQSVHAAELPNPTTMENLGGIITKVSGLIPPIAVVGFIGSILYAGFTRMTAAGNAEKEAKSMKIAIAAATGFLIIALAPLIVRLVGWIFGIRTEIL